jgi:hypothetical protein
MARLRITEAAKVAGVSRVTLFRYVKGGKLTRHPDGTVDTAELQRAGFTLQQAAQLGKRVAQRLATSGVEVPPQASIPLQNQLLTAVERERDVLQRELDATRETLRQERDAALERERVAREQIALLLQMLQDAQQQSQRLLDMPRQPSPTPAPALSHRPADVSDTRQRILEYMRTCGRPVRAGEVQEALGLESSPRHTLKKMARAGVLRRIEQGVYEVT